MRIDEMPLNAVQSLEAGVMNEKCSTQVDFLKVLQEMRGIDQLLQVTARLRHPTKGCPWDLKQTHQSLQRYMLEEAYEAVEVMGGEANMDSLKEELGDVLLQVALHSRLAEEAGHFDFEAVCETIAEKLIRRHPHVFGDVAQDDNGKTGITDADAVTRQWEQIKRAEKRKKSESPEQGLPDSILAGVSKSKPALSRALETSRRAVKVGFEWPDLDALWACVMSEYDEFRTEADVLAHYKATSQVDKTAAIPEALYERLEEEMGDILFASVNLARHFDIDPEVALTRATAKFTRRFQKMEALIMEQRLQNTQQTVLPEDFSLSDHMKTLNFETWDSLWLQAKQQQGAKPESK